MAAVIFGGYGAVPPHALHALIAVVAADVVGCAVMVLPRLRWWCLLAVPLLGAAGAWWLLANQPVEGGILHVFRTGTGISVADMTAVLAFLTALTITARYVLQRLAVRPRRIGRRRAPRER